MDRRERTRIAHAHHPIAAPVSTANVQALLDRAEVPAEGRLLDLGCGGGVWLTEALAMRPTATGVGVDLDLPADVAGTAAARGVAGRVRWEQDDARTWTGGAFDLVICVGAEHAFGGVDGALDSLRRHLRPGGQLLLGVSTWEGRPSAAAQAVLEAGPEDLPDLAGLFDRARAHGFEPGYGHVSTLEEWDEYEFSWTGSLVAWALQDTAAGPDREEALAAARDHRDAWARGWRRQLGFATVLLHDLGPEAARTT